MYCFDKVDSEDDRVDHDEAYEKFKTLFKVYSVLSDSERKWVYDETGKFQYFACQTCSRP